MNAIECTDGQLDPAWDSFGISRTDFRPHWDGDLVNVFTSVGPQEDEESTAELMKDCAVEMAKWVLGNRDRFGRNDKFQIIIAWPISVRESGRHTIKTGGTYEDLQMIVSGHKTIEIRPSWSGGVFEKSTENKTP